jgi:plasmid stability protein
MLFACKVHAWQNGFMPAIQIRDVPDHIYRRLVESAQREHRSLSQQALTTLAAALGTELDPIERRKQQLTKIRSRQGAYPRNLPDPVQLIREDRDR